MDIGMAAMMFLGRRWIDVPTLVICLGVRAGWILWTLLLLCIWPLAPAAALDPLSDRGGPFFYDFRFQLEVTGDLTLLSQSRYCRLEDLHLRLAANPSPDGWLFHSLRLVQDEEPANFGVGEGPKKHQRYLLFEREPTPAEQSEARERVVRLEARMGCGVGGETGRNGEGKEAFINEYLWRNPNGGVQFLVSPGGRTLYVTDHTEVSVLLREGGVKAKPRFFETLKYALLAVPPLSDTLPTSVSGCGPEAWTVPCQPLYEGLADLVRDVYGRKMSLLNPEALRGQQLTYEAQTVLDASVLRIRAAAGRFTPADIRVSGLKGTLAIEGFQRQIYFDVAKKRVLKDVVDINFGIERDTTLFRIEGGTNRVRVLLVDECLAGVADTDEAVRAALATCGEVPLPSGQVP